ncbi:hypothetical protein BDR22DRAFT_974670 [Usnea florida]
MSKQLLSKPTPGACRNGPDHYFDAVPPAYEDVVKASRPVPARNQAPQSNAQRASQDPPKYIARIIGTHVEHNGYMALTGRNSESFGVFTVHDFDVWLDMTYPVVPSPDASHSLLCQDYVIPLPQANFYRSHRTRTDYFQESAPDAETYIHSYVSSSFPVRSFTLNRRILHHDSAALKALITSIVRSTDYCGDLQVHVPVTQSRVTVYSPCWQNHYRERLWLRWIFYLTFLWVISWPYLRFVTHR